MSKIKNPNALIRIGDVIKVLCREKCYPGPFCPDSYCTEMWNKFEDVERVDAVPVVHGRWIKMGHIEHTWLISKCSVCGNQTIDAGTYCTNCGARMDEKDGGND